MSESRSSVEAYGEGHTHKVNAIVGQGGVDWKSYLEYATVDGARCDIHDQTCKVAGLSELRYQSYSKEEVNTDTIVGDSNGHHYHKFDTANKTSLPYSLAKTLGQCPAGHPKCMVTMGAPYRYFTKETYSRKTGYEIASDSGHYHIYEEDHIKEIKRLVELFTLMGEDWYDYCSLGHFVCKVKSGYFDTTRTVYAYISESIGGYIWCSDEAEEETEFHYIDGVNNERAIEGTLVGDSGGSGYIGVGGTYYYYIDSLGDRRWFEGTLTGITGKVPQQISINLSLIHI